MGSSDRPQIGLDHPQSQEYIQSRLRDHQESGDEKVQSRKVGIRDRVGCYTWTWFAMTMATGGIANVLHGSKLINVPHCCSCLMYFSTLSF
jgi:hypothetical protein